MTNATDFIVSLIRKDAHRLLKLYFPHDDGPASGLLINHLVAEEHLSRDFTYTVTVLSDDPDIKLTDVQGRMVCVEVLREAGPSRYFNGYCFEFRLLRVENSLAFYEMVLRPWLALFALRADYRLFHHQNIAEQTKTIFRETGLASHAFALNNPDPQRTFSCQYDETDHNYLHRRWEEMGWHYWYEHTLSGHKLMLSDTSQDAQAVDGNPMIAYHHAGGSNRHDKIGIWSPGRKLVSGKVSLSGFDFKRPSPQAGSNASSNEQGAIHQIEVYRYQGLYGFRHPAHGIDIATLRMEATDAPSRQFRAKSDSRAVQPGRWFCLNKDYSGQIFEAADANVEFFITSVRHVVDNNYLSNDGAHASYENEFTCAPRNIPWRPEPGFNSAEVKVGGVDTATVVGSGGQDIYTDEYGRIRVQFHWDRDGKNDAASSAWVRVASNWAGAELGAMAIPRVGSEVVVQYLSGNPDRPLVTGSVYNARKMPPWQLPSQQALTGLRSRELTPGGGNAASGRSNHLILDDTHQKIQAQLKSDHQSSQLSLGHITRIDSNAGRKDWRGEGFELRTDGWGAVRAAKGMLFSTEGRNAAASHIKDMDETVQRLEMAQGRHQDLAESAEKNGAQEKGLHQSPVAQEVQAQNEAIKGSGGDFPELSRPHMVLTSPAGIETSTAMSTHISSDEHTALTTGKSLSIASGDSVFASIRKTFRLFVQQAGMKMVAAAGDIDIQALSDSINVLAKLKITQKANQIMITAKEELVINGGGSYAKFTSGNIEIGTSGKIVSHADHHSFVGPKEVPVVHDIKKIMGPFSLRWQAVSAIDGKPVAEVDVIVSDHTTKELKTEAATGGDGRTERFKHEAKQEVYNALIGSGEWGVLVTGAEQPQQLEHADWFDLEAEEENDEDAQEDDEQGAA